MPRYHFNLYNDLVVPDDEGTKLPNKRAAQDFASHLESLLREFPFQWSNFYDYWTEQGALNPRENRVAMRG